MSHRPDFETETKVLTETLLEVTFFMGALQQKHSEQHYLRIKPMVRSLEFSNNTWRQIYQSIDSDDHPELFFDEEKLKTLESIHTHIKKSIDYFKLNIEPEIVKSESEVLLNNITPLKRSLSKQRLIIENILSIEKQLRPATASDCSKVRQPSAMIEAMKKATENLIAKSKKD